MATPDVSALSQLGSNFENLPEELQRTLWEIIQEQEIEDTLPRLWEIRRITQRRLFFRGEQYWYWNNSRQIWCSVNSPDAWMDQQGEFQEPTFQHVTNIYQAYGLSIMTVISQNAVPAQFAPQSARDPKDVATAKQATRIAELIHRNNDMQNKADDATYCMWNDGFLGAYVRYVSDGERFGWDQQPEMGVVEQQIDAGGVMCDACGWSEPGASTTEYPICPTCASPTTDVPPQTAEMPAPTGNIITTPKGQEVIDIVGALNLKRSMWAQEQSQFMYLTWITDIHKAQAKALFPHVAEKIERSGGSFQGGNSSEGYEKLARCLLYTGPGMLTAPNWANLGTLRRTWLRPNSFERVKDEQRKTQLLGLFPQGCFVTFYNDIYCGARNECMDEKWETMQTMPGEGQVRETLGSALIPIQEQLNDASNMIFETGMYGTPEAFADKNTLDFEARSQQGAMPGNMSPVSLSANQDIRSKIMFTQATEPSVALREFKDQLLAGTPQLISGAFPALFGGDTGTNDTASGIAMQRNQALGRIGRAWRRLQVFWANLDAKAIRCFAQNRTDDVELPKLNQNGVYESDLITIEDAQGKIVAFPEVDQQYPVLQSEIRTFMTQIMEGQNPVLPALLTDPDNIDYTLTRMGLTEVQIPGEQQRKKTYLTIDMLLQQQPQILPPAPEAMAMPGVVPQPVVIPSISPDPDIDDLEIAAATAKKWCLSDDGLEAEAANPLGFANVKAYFKAADQMAKAKMLNQAVAAAALQGGGPAADMGGSQDIAPPAEESAGAGESAPTQ